MKYIKKYIIHTFDQFFKSCKVATCKFGNYWKLFYITKQKAQNRSGSTALDSYSEAFVFSSSQSSVCFSDIAVASQPWLTCHHWSASMSRVDWPGATIDSPYWSSGGQKEGAECVFRLTGLTLSFSFIKSGCHAMILPVYVKTESGNTVIVVEMLKWSLHSEASQPAKRNGWGFELKPVKNVVTVRIKLTSCKSFF